MNIRRLAIKPSITQISDQELDRDRQLFRVADDIRGERQLNLQTLAEACVNRGLTVGLEDIELLSNNFMPRGANFTVPVEVADFICELLVPCSPKTVLDPCAFSPVLALRIAERLKPDLYIAKTLSRETIDLVELVGTRGVRFKTEDFVFQSGGNSQFFDAIVSCPPFGGFRRGPVSVNVDGKSVLVRDDYASIALLKSCLQLEPDGVAIFVVSSSFFTNALRANGSLTILRSLGFDVVTAIELPPSIFRATSIRTQIVQVRRTSDRQIFAARLPEGLDLQQRLAENIRKRRTSKNLALGTLVERDGFTSYSGVESNLFVQKLALRSGFEPVPFGDVFHQCLSSRSGPNFVRLQEEPNCLFLPQMSNSPAATTQDELSPRLKSYYKLSTNPEVADAEFVVQLLNSPFGHAWRDSVKSGATMPGLTRQSLLSSTFFLPELALQRDLLRCHREINLLAGQLDELKAKLWSSPRKLPDIQNELRQMHREDRFEDWVDSLPFPIASILWLCHSNAGSVYDQFRQKLKFFEAFSQFTAVIHMSAFSSDAALWTGLTRSLSAYLEEQRLSLERASFGTWNALNERLVSEARQLLANDELACVQMYRAPNVDFVRTLTSSKILSISQRVNTIRNRMGAHDAAIPREDAEATNDLLDDFIQELRALFGFQWLDYGLIYPGSNEYDSGLHRTQVQKLQGTRQPFPWTTVEVTRPMQAGSLHLVSADSRETLELLPLIKVMAPPRTEQRACYFYDRSEPTGLHFKSYEYSPDAEKFESFPDTARALSRLFPST